MLVDAIRKGKRMRLCGDNINFWIKVRDERRSKHSHMEHYFGSIAIFHPMNLSGLSEKKPQIEPTSMTASDLILNPNDINNLIDDYAMLAMRVALQYFAYFKFLDGHLPKYRPDQHTESMTEKTKVIPLPALKKNESKYTDMVDIMRYYANLIEKLFKAAGHKETPKVHIGGDLLTRVMESGSKLLMIKAPSSVDRFDCLSPVSAEFFHMAMKLLSVIMKRLWDQGSGSDLGTMRSEQLRIQRNDVGPDTKKAYNENKEFFISYTNSITIEAICDHFGLTDINDTRPQKKSCPDPDKMYEWAHEEFRTLVKNSVGTFTYKKTDLNNKAVPQNKTGRVTVICQGQCPESKSDQQHQSAQPGNCLRVGPMEIATCAAQQPSSGDLTNPILSGTVLQKAHFHQGSHLFSASSRGNQCTPIAFVAISLSVLMRPSEWTTDVMDTVLRTGDDLYLKIPHKHKYVDYTELPKKFHLNAFNTSFEAEHKTIQCGYLGSHESSGQLYSIEDAALSACQTGTGFLLITCSYTIAVTKTGEQFFLFDSHARDSSGLPHADGTAVLLKFDSAHDVAKHVRRLYRGNLHAQFDVVSFKVSVTSAAATPVPSDVASEPETHKTLLVQFRSGKSLKVILPIRKPESTPESHNELFEKPQKADKSKDYILQAMEFGFLFKNFLQSIKTPNRERMLRTLKLMMVVLKADSNMSRYADEILRFLVHQICTLSSKEAHEMFYAMFVNTRGKLDSFIPCDLMMEFAVRAIKKHIKNMHSHKTQHNIERKTGALGCLSDLINNYDNASCVLRRTKRHKPASEEGDELSMAEDLHTLAPFSPVEGRSFQRFPNIGASMLSHLEYNHFLSWVSNRSKVHANSLGN